MKYYRDPTTGVYRLEGDYDGVLFDPTTRTLTFYPRTYELDELLEEGEDE